MTRQNLPLTTHRARSLRRSMTEAEAYLWSELRRRTLGCKYRRQYPIGPYFADFVCTRHRLVIECDGGQHDESAHDRRRDAFLRRNGWQVVRFWNNHVLGDITGVVNTVVGCCLEE